MRPLTNLFLLVLTTLMFQCSPSGEKKVEETKEEIKRDIKKEKEETAEDLRDLRDAINDKLDKISKKLDQASADSKAGLEATKETLINQRTKVENALKDIDDSAEDTWDDIQQSARNTADQVKIEFQQAREKLDDILDKNNNKKYNDHE